MQTDHLIVEHKIVTSSIVVRQQHLTTRRRISTFLHITHNSHYRRRCLASKEGVVMLGVCAKLHNWYLYAQNVPVLKICVPRDTVGPHYH